MISIFFVREEARMDSIYTTVGAGMVRAGGKSPKSLHCAQSKFADKLTNRSSITVSRSTHDFHVRSITVCDETGL